jgi:tetratricopeptide (TPR) repeat protein
MRKRRLVLLAGLLVLALLGGLGGWAYWATTRPDYRLRRGQEAARRGDFDRAEELADKLQAAGHADHAHLLRGECLYREAYPDRDGGPSPRPSPLLEQALAELSQVRDEGAIRLEAVALTGQCLLYLNDKREAERAFQFVLSQKPDHADAHRGLAAVYYDQGALERAVAHLEEVARLDPEDGRPHRFMGLIYKDLDQKERAAACYLEALRRKLKGPTAQEVRVELASVLVRSAAWDEALAALDGCDDQVADSAEVRALRAECLWNRGETSAAREQLERALAARPDAVRPLLLLAKMHLAAGEPREAVPLLERAVEADPNDHTCRHQLALAYQGLGRTGESAEQQQAADRITADLAEMTRLNREADERPWDAEVRRRLAALCDRRNKPDEAAMWRKAAADCAGAGGATR